VRRRNVSGVVLEDLAVKLMIIFYYTLVTGRLAGSNIFRCQIGSSDCTMATAINGYRTDELDNAIYELRAGILIRESGE